MPIQARQILNKPRAVIKEVAVAIVRTAIEMPHLIQIGQLINL